jgi:DNA-binding MarR family transcriptional regulator
MARHYTCSQYAAAVQVMQNFSRWHFLPCVRLPIPPPIATLADIPTYPTPMSDPYRLDTYSPDESIGYLLKRAGGQLSTTVDRALAEFDMTHAQLGIFLRLLHGHANTAADLAREMVIDTGAMTRALDRLEEKGFIRRLRSNADRRVIEVSLTENGKTQAAQMTRVAIDALNHHLRGFSPEEIDQFKHLLRRMINNA